MEEDSKRGTDTATAPPLPDIEDEALRPPADDLEDLLDTDTLTLLRLLGMC